MENNKNTTKTYSIHVGAPFVGNTRETGTTVPNQNKHTHGITLIALVITIILLLILAGVVINLTLGEHGILKQAQQAGEQYKISEILEKLELEKVELFARKNGQTPTVQEYVNHLINKGVITASDIQDIDVDNKNIIVEGYVFTVGKEANGNIKVTYQGKPDSTPKIASLQVTGTTINSISVKIIASNGDGASYKYSIKNVTAGETTFTEIATLNTNEYTFTGLPTNNNYIIQVELITSEGGDIKETQSIKTEPPKVTSITLDKTNIELVKDGTETIIASVLPTDAVDKTIIWTSSNEYVATVDDTGLVTAVGEGLAIITATANDGSGVSSNCNITVTPPPPPSVGIGANTHEAKEIEYTWEELSQIAKAISNNYGTEEGKVSNDTVEVNVSINGKDGTLGIGDWTTVNGKQVRILGFNHDVLANSGAYTGTNTYAGISFEFTEFLTYSNMNSTNTNTGGWGACELRNTLNTTTYDSLENKEYIKEVNKQYVETYNDDTSVTTVNDKLWLLSCSEIWNNGDKVGYFGYTVAREGEQYKYYKNIDAYYNTDGNKLADSLSCWWLRSTGYLENNRFCYSVPWIACRNNVATQTYGVRPGFAI